MSNSLHRPTGVIVFSRTTQQMNLARHQAPKARKIRSLGRQPQEHGTGKTKSREAATDNQKVMAATRAAAAVCRPFRAPGFL
jgi:hypothetical protein